MCPVGREFPGSRVTAKTIAVITFMFVVSSASHSRVRL
jgi:hypothetical protein